MPPFLFHHMTRTFCYSCALCSDINLAHSSSRWIAIVYEITVLRAARLLIAEITNTRKLLKVVSLSTQGEIPFSSV